MKTEDKIGFLQDNNLSEWLKQRRSTEDELSKNQTLFCVCGKLATGLHETHCRKFHQLVNKATVKKLEFLINP